MILIIDGMKCKSKPVFISVSGIGVNMIELQLVMEEGVYAYWSRFHKIII